MSYSYTDLLSAIITSREGNEFHSALEHYANLSEKCSMTPLLWLQYAQDSISVDESYSLAKEVAELALEEFPGCALLWLFYLDVSFNMDAGDSGSDHERDSWEVWNTGMDKLTGLQTSPNVMLEFFRIGVNFFPSKSDEIYTKRSSALLHGNETIVSEMKAFEQKRGTSYSICLA